MKIFVNALSARLGGGQTYLKNLFVHLPSRPDLEIHVFAPASLILPNDHRVVRRVTRWPTDNPILRALWEVFVLPRLLAREQAQVLFCPGGLIATRAPEGCRTATMFRNMIPFDSATTARIPFGLQTVRNVLLRRIMLRSMKRADRTIFVSEYARSVIEGLIRIENAVTIPHGVGESFKCAGRDVARPRWLPEGRYLLYVSRFDVYKHQEEVIRGYFALPARLRKDLTLVLVGEADKRDLAGVQRLAHDLGDGGKVFVAGAVQYEDLPGAYRHAVANIFASSCENCPNILLEALGAGRPLLSSSVAPMPEFAGNAAEYFDPFNPGSIANAMKRVLESVAYETKLGERAEAQSKKYSWKSSAARTWQCLIQLADQ